MMTVMLYGFLGKQFGKVHRYSVRSAAEAIRALCATLPGFRKALVEGGAYKVLRRGSEVVTTDSYHYPQSHKESLRIVPVVEGAGGDNGLFGVILGAALIFLAMPTGGASMGLFAKMALNVGTSMVLGGISQLLFSPAPTQVSNTMTAGSKDDASLSRVPSYAFSGTVNTVAQGNAVPVCYGRMVVGSQVISAGMHVTQ